MNLSLSIYIYVNIYMYMHKYIVFHTLHSDIPSVQPICVYMCVYVCMYIYMVLDMYKYECIYIYICIYIHAILILSSILSIATFPLYSLYVYTCKCIYLCFFYIYKKMNMYKYFFIYTSISAITCRPYTTELSISCITASLNLLYKSISSFSTSQ
jgi:hypothetical protein